MRVGPAKARPKRVKQILYDGSESEDDHVIPSEFETNDEELAVYLQTNTSFLLNMNATGGFTAAWLWSFCFDSKLPSFDQP